MTRREFIALFGGATLLPLSVQAQRDKVVGFLNSRSAEESAHLVEAIRSGLSEGAKINVDDIAIEYRWAEGKSRDYKGLLMTSFVITSRSFSQPEIWCRR